MKTLSSGRNLIFVVFFVLFLLTYLSFALPNITFVSPSFSNESFTFNNWLFVNATIDELQNQTIIEFNNTNCTIYEPSLVLNLPFEEGADTVAYDNSPYGNNGTLTNMNPGIDNCTGNCSGWTTNGKFGNALQFDGLDDYVDAGNATGLNLGVNDFTFEAWIYPKIDADNVKRGIISSLDMAQTGFLFAYVTNSGNKIYIETYDGTNNPFLYGISGVQKNTWSYVVAVRGNGNYTVYINGASSGTITDTALDVINSKNVSIGRFEGDPTAYFNGTIDEVRIYNRTLRAEEIAQHYNMSFGKYYANFTNLTDSAYSYKIYAQNTTGDWNTSETRTVTVDTVKPSISFVSPADSNNSFVSRNWTYVNVSTTDANNITTFIDFNNSLVGWWRFNHETGENDTFVRDWSSYGNNGTINNTNPGIDNCTGNCSGWTTSGKFGYGMQFDGTDDYVNAGNASSLNITNAITVEAWVKLADVNSSERLYIATKGTGFGDGTSPYGPFVLAYYTPTQRFYWDVWNETYGRRSTYTAQSKFNSTLTFYHVVGTYDASGSKLYVNGVLEDSGAYIGSMHSVTRNLLIGLNNDVPDYHFNGTIDEVRIYNRALSPEEINASYNTGSYKLYHNFTELANGAYNYTAYTQDLAGNVNQTETRTLTIDTVQPFVGFVSPTLTNNTYTNNNNTYINVSVSDAVSPNNLTAFIDFNNSLVGWWRFNYEAGENDTLVRDWSSNGKNGTMTNMNPGIDNCTGNCSGWTSSGKFGYGMKLDGVNDYVVGSDAKFPNGTTSSTMIVWFKPSRVCNVVDILFAYGTTSDNGTRGLTCFSNTQIRYFGWNNDYDVTVGTIGTAWHQVIGTFNGTHASLYFDGMPKGTSARTWNTKLTAGQYRIGRLLGSWNYYFNGTIDEVSIYNRVLSEEEINASYNAGSYRLYHNFTNTPDGTYNYTAYAQDLAGNVNQTEMITLTIDTTQPFIGFVSPTDVNNSYVGRNWTYINTTITDSSPNSTALIDFNRSLVGWWRLNHEVGENDTFARDWSSYGNNGTFFSISPGIDNCTGTCSGWTSNGKFGYGMSFDGANDFISIPTLAVGTVHSASIWIDFQDNDDGVIIGRNGAILTGMGYLLYIDQTYVYYNNGGNSGSDYVRVAHNGLTPGQWNFLSVVRNGTSVKFYKNGTQLGATQTLATNTALSDLKGIGSYEDGTYPTKMRLDEVRIYNRALFPEEINASYNAGSYSLYHNFTGLTDGAYNYTAYAQDLAGNVNQTETRTITIDSTQPFIGFVSPTDANNSFVSRNWTYINTTVTDANPNSIAFIDFNNSLVGWWRFNHETGENDTFVRDWSSYGNNGTLVNMNKGIDNGTSGWTTSGKFGNSLQFDGVGAYIGLGTSPSLSGTTDFSVQMWIKTPNDGVANGEDGMTLIAQRDGAYDGEYVVNIGKNYDGLNPQPGKLMFVVYNLGFQFEIWSDSRIDDNNWHYLTFIRNGTDGYIYIDGKMDNTSSGPIKSLVSTLATNIGKDANYNARFFNGSMDDVKLWNRALSPEEINASYNTGSYRLYHNFTNITDGSYTYAAYSQDLAGNVNQTETRILTTDATPPYSINTCRDLDITGGYYQLVTNVSSSGTCFNILANNITLDGQGYWINYTTGAEVGYGINSSSGKNLTIKNLKIMQGNTSSAASSYAIYLINGTDNKVHNNSIRTYGTNAYGIFFNANGYTPTGINITNNTIVTTGTTAAGIYVNVHNNLNISNNIVNSSGDALYIYRSTAYRIINNTLYSQANLGVHLYDPISATDNGVISDGSIISKSSADYYLRGVDTTNNFTATNFTAKRWIQFFDTISWFNYQNDSTNSIWLKTNVSTAASINRTLVTWSQATMKWNDTNDTVALKVRYNLTGLYVNTNYNITNTTLQGSTSQTLTTDATGVLPSFTIDLNGNTELTVTDNIAPGLLFVSPTDTNSYYANRNWTYINTTLSDASNSTALVDFNRSLVGWWRFNNETGENSTFFRDWSSYGNNASCPLSVCPSYITGKYGSALDYDGNDDYISASDSTSLNLSGNMTIEAWVYPKRLDGYYVFVSKRYGAGYGQWKLALGAASDWGIEWWTGATWRDYVGGSLSLNQWVHLACVVGPSWVKCYKNGELSHQYNDITIDMQKTDGPLFFGYTGSASAYTKASIDEVKIWNRVLSPEEINASYDAGVYRLYHNFTNITDGTYNYTAYAQDLAGNINQTETRTLTVDTTPPYSINTCRDLDIVNGYYQLISNISSSGTCFNILANNITLDGLGYWVNYSQDIAGYAVNNTYNNNGYDNTVLKNMNIVQGNTSVQNSDAIYLWGVDNSTITNNTISTYGTSSAGIVLRGSAFNNVTDNTINTNGTTNSYGIWLYTSSSTITKFNNISNNTVIANRSTYGILLQGSSSTQLVSNNTLINNKVTTRLNAGRTIEPYLSDYNNITDGSYIAEGFGYSYYFSSSYKGNRFWNTNFTAARYIWFTDNQSVFNYNNETGGNIWLGTNISTPSGGYILRTLITWSNSTMKWNDTNSTAGITTANYNITGISASKTYYIHNISGGVHTNPYTLTTDSSGSINFNITLNGNTKILVTSIQPCSAVVVSGNIFTGNCTTMTEVSAAIDNAALLQDLGSGNWLLNANMTVNGSVFYINSTDVSWLKINSTGNDIHYIAILNGTTHIYDTKITSWNSTSNDVDTRTSDTRTNPRAYIYADGAGSYDGNLVVTNSNISYLGYEDAGGGPTPYDGIACSYVTDCIINNTVTINNYYGLRTRYSYNVTFYNNTLIYPVTQGILINHDTDSFDATQPTEYGHSQILNNSITANIPLTGQYIINLNEANYNEFKYNTIRNEGLSPTIIFDRASYNLLSDNNVTVSNTSNAQYTYTIGSSTTYSAYNRILYDTAQNQGSGNLFTITGGSNHTYIEGVNFTSVLAPVSLSAFKNLTIINSTFSSTGVGSRGMIFNGVSNITYIYNSNISSNNNDGIQIANANAKNITLEDVRISSGTGNSVNIVGDTTNKFINVSYSTLTTSSGGILNYYYNTLFNLPYLSFTVNVYQNESLNDTRVSASGNIRFPVKTYDRNGTQWWYYTQKFEINNATANANYVTKRNGINSQTVQSNGTGFLIFYEQANQSELNITIAGDTTPPMITIASPQNQSYSTNSIWFNITGNEVLNWSGYSLDGVTNVSLTNSSGNWNNLSTVAEGLHNVTFYANDSVGNINSTNITFEVRTVWYATMELNKTNSMRGKTISLNGTIQDALSNNLTCTGCLNITWGSVLHSGVNVSGGYYNDTYNIAASDSNMAIQLNVSNAGKSGSNTTSLAITPTYTVLAECGLRYINRNQSQFCNATIKDIDGIEITDSMTVNFTLAENTTYNDTDTSYPYSWTFNTPFALGNYTLKANASDPYNNTGINNTIIFEVRNLNISLSKSISVLNNKGQYSSNSMVFSRYDTGTFSSNITITINATDEKTGVPNDANVSVYVYYPNATILNQSSGETSGGIYEYNFNLIGTAPQDSGNYTVLVNATDSQNILGNNSNAIPVSFYVLEINYNTTQMYFKGSILPFNITVRYNGTLTNASSLEAQLRDDNSIPQTYEYYPGDIYYISEGKYSGNFTTESLISGSAYFLYVKIPEIESEDKHADITIQSDPEAPTFGDNKTSPVSPASYSPAGYMFNVTASDNSGTIDTVILDMNGTNQTVSAYRAINSTHYEYYTTRTLTPGTYQFRWYANDTSGNTSSTVLMDYEIVKAEPSITLLLNGTNSNRTYEKGDYANITASINITGKNISLWANFSGSLVNIQNGTTALTNITNTSSLSIGTYIVNASFDGDENYTAVSSVHYLSVEDTQGPVITIIQKTSPIEYGAQQNISSNIADIDNVSSAVIQILGQNYTMNQLWWYSWTPLNSLGSIAYIIFANDTFGNWNSVLDSFTIQDTTPPSIDSYSINPEIPKEGDTVTITANISDNYNISEAWLYVRTPSLNSTEMQLVIDGTSYSNNYIAEESGNNTFVISANDTEGNLANTTIYVTVLNPGNLTVSPLYHTATVSVGASNITNFTVNNTGGMNTTVNIYDNSGWVSYSETIFNLSGGEEKNITANITVPLATTPDTYTISIIANSSIGDGALTAYITVPDEEAPIITSISYQNISYGQTETISVNATDNKQLDACTMKYEGTNITMPGCTYAFVPSTVGLIQFTVYVNDTSGNINSSQNTFKVTDIIAPNISYELRPRAVIVGLNVSINASGTDDYLIDTVWANITMPDETSELIAIPSNITAAISGRYNVIFFANDTSGNNVTATSWFIAENNITFIINTTLGNTSSLPSNITLYFPDTAEIINSSNSNGTVNFSLPAYSYDLKISVFDDTEIKLLGSNMSDNPNATIAADNVSVEGYLKTLAVNVSKINYSSATLTLGYSSANYTNENYLGVYKCTLWNFSANACNSEWNVYGNFSQNKTSKQIVVYASSFSAYAIKQEPYCGNGAVDSGETCTSCPADAGSCGESSSNSCTNNIAIWMENETLYEGVPANILLSVRNDGTCVLYRASLAANWTSGNSTADLSDLYAGDSKKILLLFSNPDAGMQQLTAYFSSLNYNTNKKFEYYVKAKPQIPQIITEPRNNFSENNTENITDDMQKAELTNDSEEEPVVLKEPKAKYPYLVYIVTAIVLIVASFALHKKMGNAPKKTLEALPKARKKQNLHLERRVAKKDDLSDIQMRLAEIKIKLDE